MTPKEQLPDPFHTVFATVFNVNSLGENWQRHVHSWTETDPEWDRLLRQQWADAILHGSVTPEQYESLTSQHFDAQESLRGFLAEHWKKYYGYELTSDQQIFEPPPSEAAAGG